MWVAYLEVALWAQSVQVLQHLSPAVDQPREDALAVVVLFVGAQMR